MLYIKQIGGTSEQMDTIKPRRTVIKGGDVIQFYTKEKTVSIHRPSLRHNKGLRFGPPGKVSWDDKIIFEITNKDPEQLLEVSKILGIFFGLRARFENSKNPMDEFGVVRIEFVSL